MPLKVLSSALNRNKTFVLLLVPVLYLKRVDVVLNNEKVGDFVVECFNSYQSV
jgi:hypothetical protein